jgi:N-acetylmuramoyl-L-alanine amidase
VYFPLVPRLVTRYFASEFGVLLALIMMGIPTWADAAQPPIVIDPGHGGNNLGAAGRSGSGVREKRLVLKVAQRIGHLLRARGYEVRLTRDDDRYLTLRERVRRANAASARTFVSLHANASPDHTQQGVEVYVLSRAQAEVEARRDARRAGPGARAMLADLAAAKHLDDGVRLAQKIQQHLLRRRPGVFDRGVRQSGFDVLAGVHAPAVLVEMGFIDHIEEGAALLDEQVQEQIALAISDGIEEFLKER